MRLLATYDEYIFSKLDESDRKMYLIIINLCTYIILITQKWPTLSSREYFGRGCSCLDFTSNKNKCIIHYNVALLHRLNCISKIQE